MFDQAELNALESPAHLRQLPADEVARLTAIIRSELPHMPTLVLEELRLFAGDPTVHNAGRLSRALRYAGREGLAREIEDALGAD